MIRDRSQFSLLFCEFFKPQGKAKATPAPAPALRFFDMALADMLASAARPVARSPRRA